MVDAPRLANAAYAVIKGRIGFGFNPLLRRLAIAAIIALAIIVAWRTGPPMTAAQSDQVPIKPASLTAEAGDSQVKLSWDDPADASITNYQLWQHTPSSKLSADIQDGNDEFGYDITIDGDTAVVGMPGDDDAALNAGAAFVFTRDPTTRAWSQVAKLRASDGGARDAFGNSVALQGDTIVIGAPRIGGGSSDGYGAAYVFAKSADANGTLRWGEAPNSGTHREETVKLMADARTDSDEFSWRAVSVDGDTIVVGAYNKNAAYIFTKSAGVWGKTPTVGTHRIETVELTGEGSFGRSVAIDGETIVIGASEQDESKGSAFVFSKPATGWANLTDTETAKLTASNRMNNDFFGGSVAIDGRTIVVGATGKDFSDFANVGKAYLFIKPETGWANSPGIETVGLTASDRDANDQFGYSVAVDGDIVVVGADAINTPRSGSAYVFTKPPTGWADSTGTELAKLTESKLGGGVRFGISVAVFVGNSGVTVMAGTNGLSDSQGAAYVYDILGWSDIEGSTAATTSHFVTGLTNEKYYAFAVRGVNINGAGPPDNDSGIPEAKDDAPLKPRNLSAVQTSTDQVRLEWRLSDDPLTVTGYKYQEDGGSFISIGGTDSQSVSHTVSITNPTVGTAYTFAVRASNSAGDSQSSHSRSVTIVAAPLRVAMGLSALAGDRQVQLTWSLSGGTGSITGFQYRYKTGEEFGDDWTDVPGSTETTTSHIATGLTNDITYTLQVRAVDGSIGSTPAETSAQPTAKTSPPGQPANLSAAQTGEGQTELTWRPASRPLTVAGYRYSADGGSTWHDIAGSDSSTVSYTVSGLMAAPHTFAVRAVNGRDESPSSNSVAVTLVAKPIAPTGLNTEAGDTQATVDWNRPPQAPPTPRPPIDKYQLLQVPLSKLTASLPGENDNFGYSLAIDGNTAVVGAPGASGGQGAAYVFVRTSGVWDQPVELTASGGANDKFGTSVAVDGSTVVVGAPGNTTNTGAAYLFTEPDTDSGGWTGTIAAASKLTGTDGAVNDKFGTSVAVDGSTVVVGAPGNTTNTGAAYVFTEPDTDSGGWTGTIAAASKLTGTDGAVNDELGISVAVAGNTVVAGAHKYDAHNNAGSGGVYVFTKTGNAWAEDTETALLTADDGASNDEFGISVAIDVATVLIGAHQPDYDVKSETIKRPGAAYAFIRDSNSGKWSQEAKLIAPDGAPSDGFGISVAVDGDRAVVGAYLYDQSDLFRDNNGSAYVFSLDSTGWRESVRLAAPDAASEDRFGYSVALSSGAVLAGIPQDDDNNQNDAGAAYMISIADRMDFKAWTDLDSRELTVTTSEYYYRSLNLDNDQEYGFRVRSVNKAGNTNSAETESATPRSAKPGATTGLAAQAGRRRVNLSWDRSYDSSITGYQVSRLMIRKHTASDPETNDNFGSALAVDNGTAVVGAPGGNGGKGAAYVFARNSAGAWSQVAELTALNDGAENDMFGHSVAVHGDTAVVGAPGGNGGKGAAYVFTRASGVWGQPVKLTDGADMAGDEFGHSVAVHGDTVVVGAYQDDDNGSNSGSTYVFTWDTQNKEWSEAVKLNASDADSIDYFGYSVAVHDDTIVIGAYGDGDKGNISGAAYVFTWNTQNNEWSQAMKLTAYDGAAGDQFGRAVAVDDDTVVVGAWGNNSNQGAAYVFTRPDTGWANDAETAKLTASDGGGADYFGHSVAVSGDVVVIGAYAADIVEADEDEDDDNSKENFRSGAAYLFAKPDSDDWVVGTETAKLILPDRDGKEEEDEFGNSVAVDSQSIIVGAPEVGVAVENNQEVQDAGSIYASGIPDWNAIAPSDDTTTAHTVTNLSAGVEYTFQVRAVDIVGEGPPSNIVRAKPRRRARDTDSSTPTVGGTIVPPVAVVNEPPSFGGAESFTVSMDENSPLGAPVGMPLTATDPNGDILTYSLSGDQASLFAIDSTTGQLTVEARLDFEANSVYQVMLLVSDGAATTTIVVTISVTNLDEPAAVQLSRDRAQVGVPVFATLTDPDGDPTNVVWKWAISLDRISWQYIVAATSSTYTPIDRDADRYLRVSATYDDGEGAGKTAEVVSDNPVQRAPLPVATPTPVPTPDAGATGATPVPTPDAGATGASPVPTPVQTQVPLTAITKLSRTALTFRPPTLTPSPATAPTVPPRPTPPSLAMLSPTVDPTPAPPPAAPLTAPADEGGFSFNFNLWWILLILLWVVVMILTARLYTVMRRR